MKKTLSLLASIATAALVQAQTQVRIVHNSADPAAAQVDVYLNGTKVLDNFAFREATPILTVNSGMNDIGIAGPNSMSVNDTLKNFQLNLANNQSHLAVVSGVLNPSNFAPNPNGASTALDIDVLVPVNNSSSVSGFTQYYSYHGSTDAPMVDFVRRGSVITIFDNAVYGNFNPTPIATGSQFFALDIMTADQSATVVSYEADFTGRADQVGLIFASGFLDPSANQNGPSFGIFIAWTDGTVQELETLTDAYLQVIHNAADPAANQVDIYVNGTLLLDNFAFRDATPYVAVPSYTELNIGVAPANSASAADTLRNFVVNNLRPNQNYLAIANGVVNPAGFAANPDGRATDFTIWLQNEMRDESASGQTFFDFRVVHGATDAPAVDVIANGALTLVNDAAYGDITEYLSVPVGSYTVSIALAAGSPVVASYTADLTALGGQSGVIFASGFLTPATNQNGQAFGLYVALSNGTVVALPVISGVETLSNPLQANLFPNPAGDRVVVRLSGLAAETFLELNDATGRVLKAMPIQAGLEQVELQLNDLSNGVYFLRLSDGKQSTTAKLLINK